MPAASTSPQREIDRIRAGVVRPRGVRNDDADRRPWARKRPFRTRPAERVVHPVCPCRATSGSLNRDNSRSMSQECAAKCRSLRMIEWSRHSRLTLPIRRSTYGFCHGLRGAVTTSSTPIAVTVERERLPVCAVPVADQVPRRRAPRECLSDLLCDPRHRRVRRDTEMHDLAALVVEHDEPEQEVERGRGDHEEIDRRQAIGVICKECPPRLRWRRWVTDHVFRDGGLGDGKAKLQKLAHGSEVRPTVCSPATSVGPDSGSPSTPAVGPVFRRRDFHVQKSLNPLRCQPMTVSGLTITRAWRQPGHRQDRMTQKTLSAFRSNGRGLFRFRTATCCRRARISVWSAARSAKISMILCMPERVSGGDAKFQGFCDGWNKWEGQAKS